ncbi:uncharacterized protein LOC134357429 [Mobula hypostoma]|uniref:uncharacterized protein LOC134357429 n=1 Tax=Mobula hypostoma TaxID=723540 RepID=UPI002FC29FE0
MRTSLPIHRCIHRPLRIESRDGQASEHTTRNELLPSLAPCSLQGTGFRLGGINIVNFYNPGQKLSWKGWGEWRCNKDLVKQKSSLLWKMRCNVYGCTWQDKQMQPPIPKGVDVKVGAVQNPDLMETAVRSTEEHLEKLLKCPLRCHCHSESPEGKAPNPQLCLLPVAGAGTEALGGDGAQCRRAGRRLGVFGRTQSWTVVGCCIGKFAALEVHRLREMMGLSRDFETFTLPMVCSY